MAKTQKLLQDGEMSQLLPPSPDARRLVITLLGPDRPGIVASVAAVVAEHGGNWMESRMVHLGGQFAGLVRAQVPAHASDELRQAIEGLAQKGLRFTIEDATETEATPAGRTVRLELVTPDRPGILREVSRILAHHGLNVEELATEFVAAPWSGELLFKANLAVTAPVDLDTDALRDALEETSAGMMLDVSVSFS